MKSGTARRYKLLRSQSRAINQSQRSYVLNVFREDFTHEEGKGPGGNLRGRRPDAGAWGPQASVADLQRVIRRIEAHQDLPPDALTASASIVRKFIEDYHEKIEEEYLFPRFRQAGKMVELVDVLEMQHQRGRSLTGTILGLSTQAALKDVEDRQRLKGALQLFARMYEPHEAREDTVLFLALRKIVSRNEYDALGEEFEKKEHELLGEDGFERNVAEVGRIEQHLGIHDLEQFTPPE